MKRVRESKRLALLCGVLSLLLVMFGFGCVQKTVHQTSSSQVSKPVVKKATTSKVVKRAKKTKTVKTKVAKVVVAQNKGHKNIYAVTPKPLKFTECIRCHKAEFEDLKYHGGKHQAVSCTACHTKFHCYNPLKHNYKQIMPKCSQCHNPPPHGKNPAVIHCLACHKNPHAPITSLPKPVKMAKQCKLCHANIAAEMKKHPSAHAQLQCSDCHSKYHGRIPNCSECHQNHSPLVKMGTKQCLICHPVHTPLMISYPCKKSMNAVCAGCHSKQYNELRRHHTKHSDLACAQCHPHHAMWLKCQQCHGLPHGKALAKKFPNCLTCHVNPHNLNAVSK